MSSHGFPVAAGHSSWAPELQCSGGANFLFSCQSQDIGKQLKLYGLLARIVFWKRLFQSVQVQKRCVQLFFYVKLSELMLYWMIPILMISFIRTSFWALGVETQPFLEGARFLFCLYSLVKSQSGEALVQSS